MSVEETVALLLAELKDDIIGMIERSGNAVKLIFTDGTVRTVTVA